MNTRAALLLIAIMVTAPLPSLGQNMLLTSPEKIEKYVKEIYPGMVQEKNFRNEHYRYLKFTDSSNKSRTILFFLTDRDKCNAIRYIYESGAKDEIVADLNKEYRYTGDNRWYDLDSWQKASVELVDEKWFITVTIKLAETGN